MKNKRVSVANFNTVFLEKDGVEAPLLAYFDSIVMPALKSGIQKKSGDDSYIIMNVNIQKEVKQGNFVLTGYIVKKTVLERFSDLDENGDLIEMDDRYSAAPFSTFVIFLQNHRMLFVENQKGSPKINSFRSTIKFIIDKYVREKNKELSQSGDILLPTPLVNVVGIPSRKSIENELKEVSRISKLTLRFFPLNGDGDNNFSGVFAFLSKEARAVLGSKTGSVIYNSPQNTQGVINLLSEVDGTVEPVINVVDNNSAKKTIRNDAITERMDINISGNNLKEEISNSIIIGSELDSISHTSAENNYIYEQNIGKILPFIRREE